MMNVEVTEIFGQPEAAITQLSLDPETLSSWLTSHLVNNQAFQFQFQCLKTMKLKRSCLFSERCSLNL